MTNIKNTLLPSSLLATLLPTLLTMLLAVLLAMLMACSASKDLPPAPLDSISGLESLAAAYSAEASKIALSPIKLQPSARKQFVVAVFNKANYSYAKTLQSFRQRKQTPINKNIKDLAELLSLPHKNISQQSKKELYSEQELEAVKLIDKIVN